MPVLESLGADAVYLVYMPRSSRFICFEHAVQRLEERSQPAWDEDDDGVGVPLEGLDERVVFVAVEVVQHQDACALLDDCLLYTSPSPRD